ncbi:WD40-repeat-containing domain protein [Lipomyces japonicus]|uniref:WD40-repeat-containing domain protein n=1 Tax=Lipomyces japonicus TaxID=56871 RepID=UPI0034CF5705
MEQDSEGVFVDDLRVDTDYVMTGTSVKAQTYLTEVNRRKAVRQLAVPTDDGKVRARLRALNEPVTLFAEDKEDRRDRLRRILFDLGEDVEMAEAGQIGGEEGQAEEEQKEDEEEEEEEEEFYTPGDDDLLSARRDIAEFSLRRARDRHRQQVADARVAVTKLVKHARQQAEVIRSFALVGTEYVSDRAVSAVRVSADGGVVAAGSWTGSIRVVGVNDLADDATSTPVLRGHTDKIGGLAWLPDSSTSRKLVSGAGDGTVRIWAVGEQDTAIATLRGHEGRVCRVAAHASGRYVGSASFDYTWRLWDADRQVCVQVQEGHSKEVYAIGFHPDGGLAVTGGLDGVGRVWDLRTGKTVMVLDQHSREVYATEFAPDGYHVATGSGDSTVKIWDMRRVRVVHSVPAHQNLVSDLRFFDYKNDDGDGDDDSGGGGGLQQRGSMMVTGGYDGKVNVWKTGTWAQVASFGAGGRVLSVDAGDRTICSGGWDRAVKVWGPEG